MKVKLAIALSLVWFNCAKAEPLPDGEVTVLGTMKAYLIAPTRRYPHGALGDKIEAGGFAVESAGTTRRYLLPDSQVFEDLRVRLHDIDADGDAEAVIILSDVEKGAAIAVYDLSTSSITLKAQSRFIGQANRWLNIADFGDFTGAGESQIAAVVTPHLAGSLRIYALQGRMLVERARIDGFSNHRFGARDLDLAVVGDQNGDGVPDITLPRIDGSGTATVTFKAGIPAILQP